MSLKIGQVNLIDFGEGLAAFNIMYTADDAFKKNPPSEFRIAVYAGKKKLSACSWHKPSEKSAQYSGDDSTVQGYTNQKKISSGPNKGLGPNERAVNMYYASSVSEDRASQAAYGAGSGGVHTIIAIAMDATKNAMKIVDARVITCGKPSGLIDNQGTGFKTLGLNGVNDVIIMKNEPHPEITDVGPVVKISNNKEGAPLPGLVITQSEGSQRPEVKEWGVGEHKATNQRTIKFDSHTLLTNFAFQIFPDSGANTATSVKIMNKDGTVLGEGSGYSPVAAGALPVRHFIDLTDTVTDEVTIEMIPQNTSQGYASIWSCEFNKAGEDTVYWLYNGMPYPNTAANRQSTSSLERKIDALVEINLKLIELLKQKLL